MGNTRLPPEDLVAIGERIRELIGKHYGGVEPMLRAHPKLFNRNTVYNWTNGKQAPGALSLVNFCTVTESSADYVLFGRGPAAIGGLLEGGGAVLNHIRDVLRERGFQPELIDSIMPDVDELIEESVQICIGVAEARGERDRRSLQLRYVPLARSELLKNKIIVDRLLTKLSSEKPPSTSPSSDDSPPTPDSTPDSAPTAE